MPYKHLEDARRRDKRYAEARKEAAGLDAPFVRPMQELKIKAKHAHGLCIGILPDCQVRPGVPVEHLTWAGKYFAHKQPEVIVCIGDFCDMSSLSTHNESGSLQLEGKRYKKDVESVLRAMELFMKEIRRVPSYKPTLVMTLGNHEDRITRTVHREKKLEGLISVEDLQYREAGWLVQPFLQPVTIAGVAFCHYFPSGVMGRPIGSAKQILTKLHMSAFAGHQQGRDIAYSQRADGREMTAIISGSFYQHAEEYMSPFTNNHWRGLYMLHEVKDGSFDEMAVSMGYLKRRFGS
jgi:hypothetical protein